MFQEMLARVKGQRGVDYIVVYQFNRIFRNSVGAAITKKELAKVGTRVVPSGGVDAVPALRLHGPDS